MKNESSNDDGRVKQDSVSYILLRSPARWTAKQDRE